MLLLPSSGLTSRRPAAGYRRAHLDNLIQHDSRIFQVWCGGVEVTDVTKFNSSQRLGGLKSFNQRGELSTCFSSRSYYL